MKVFISYTRKDNVLSEDKLISIRSLFLNKNILPYIDCLVPNTTQELVEQELKSSTLVLVIKTQKVYESKWVNKELTIAKDNNIPIIERTYNELFDINSLSFLDNYC